MTDGAQRKRPAWPIVLSWNVVALILFFALPPI